MACTKKWVSFSKIIPPTYKETSDFHFFEILAMIPRWKLLPLPHFKTGRGKETY
jgi:hypothetical protein